jgi:hypothetical protein
MDINVNSLISIEKALKEAEAVFRTFDEFGKVLILKDNEPAYILLKYEICKSFLLLSKKGSTLIFHIILKIISKILIAIIRIINILNFSKLKGNVK